MIERVLTIGAYGKTESQFLSLLERAAVDTFCDIRQRRGVRGSQYAFVNSKRLQAALAARGIAYRYVPELAPTQQIRQLQHEADSQQGMSKRTRHELGETFKQRYTEEILAPFDTKRFRQTLEPASRRIALFCVEGTAAACHRSLAAEWICTDFDVPLEHL
jgi:uncharacterized protein (DUF488 family)